MTSGTISPDFLIPCGRLLLGGSFAFCLLKAMRGNFDLHLSFERLVI